MSNTPPPVASALNLHEDAIAAKNMQRFCLIHPTIVTIVFRPEHRCISGNRTLLGAMSAARLSRGSQLHTSRLW